MSLSQDPALSLLETKLVCGWRNIKDEAYCGRSHEHAKTNPAVATTNGAGPHNTQLFLLAPDGTVLHCLPGYWDARDLAHEIAFAEKLNAVWSDASLDRTAKDARWKELHLAHVQEHPKELVDRSVMQGFDKKFEKKRESVSDCILREGATKPKHRPRRDDEFKTTDQLVHERLAVRPFVAYESFDVAKFVDYGRPLYDKKQDECGESLGSKQKKEKREKKRAAATP